MRAAPEARHIRGLGIMIVVGVGLLACACECVDRRYLDAEDSSGSGGSEMASSGEVTTPGDVNDVDVSAFLGVFHNESWLVPLGMEVENPGGATVSNLEIRADGTASMTMEGCSESIGTVEFAWRWEARPGPRLAFSPGPGEESLRFMGLAELESLEAFLIEPCAFQFEADGVLVATETFRPGRACWVNRCVPAWRIEIGYCDGEGAVGCE